MHNGIRDMQFILEQRDSWRAEKVPEHIREMIARYYSPEMNPYDAAALYWYVRNNFLYEQGLDESPDVMMCKYEDFVMDPQSSMREIYRFVSRRFPDNDATERVHRASVGKGSDTPLSLPSLPCARKCLPGWTQLIRNNCHLPHPRCSADRHRCLEWAQSRVYNPFLFCQPNNIVFGM